jgi:hypothetical protein
VQNNSTHAMFPDATHDEQALQSFIRTLRVHALREFRGGAQAVLEKKEPALRAANGGAPPTRKQLREALARTPHHRWWSSMLRTTQEMLYETTPCWRCRAT